MHRVAGFRRLPARLAAQRPRRLRPLTTTPRLVLSRVQAGPLLAARRAGETACAASPDLGVSTETARLHKAGEQTDESLERFTVYTIETARMLLRPPIDTAVSLLLHQASQGRPCRIQTLITGCRPSFLT